MRTFTFNNIRSDVYFLTSKMELPITPEIDFDVMKVTARNGVIPSKSYMGARTFKIKVTLLSTDPADMRQKCRDIAKWLYTDTERTLYFSDEPAKTYQAKIQGGIDLDQLVNLGEADITFIAPNPLANGSTFLGVAVSQGGTVTNTGTARAYPIIYFTPSAALSNGITFTNTTTGKSTILTGAFTSGRKYKIDYTLNQVIDTVSGAKLMTQIDIDADFWYLQSGANVINWTPTTAAVTLDYTERFY